MRRTIPFCHCVVVLMLSLWMVLIFSSQKCAEDILDIWKSHITTFWVEPKPLETWWKKGGPCLNWHILAFVFNRKPLFWKLKRSTSRKTWLWLCAHVYSMCYVSLVLILREFPTKPVKSSQWGEIFRCSAPRAILKRRQAIVICFGIITNTVEGGTADHQPLTFRIMPRAMKVKTIVMVFGRITVTIV